MRRQVSYPMIGYFMKFAKETNSSLLVMSGKIFKTFVQLLDWRYLQNNVPCVFLFIS